MEATTTSIPRRTALTVAVLAVLFAGLTVLLEAVFHLPLKLPGHRALPGAVALVLFAEAPPPLLLLAFSAVVPLAVFALGGGPLWIVAPWLALAVLLVGLRDARWRKATWFLVVAGLLFGALRAGVLSIEVHHTPSVLRWAGHMGFGAAGGLLAALLRRIGEPPAESGR